MGRGKCKGPPNCYCNIGSTCSFLGKKKKRSVAERKRDKRKADRLVKLRMPAAANDKAAAISHAQPKAKAMAKAKALKIRRHVAEAEPTTANLLWKEVQGLKTKQVQMEKAMAKAKALKIRRCAAEAEPTTANLLWKEVHALKTKQVQMEKAFQALYQHVHRRCP